MLWYELEDHELWGKTLLIKRGVQGGKHARNKENVVQITTVIREGEYFLQYWVKIKAEEF